MADYKLQIKEAHLDTFGHVNNATYLELYEEARWQVITEGGFGLDVIQKDKKGPVILESYVKYKKELKNRENIKITFNMTEIRGVLMFLEQEMILDDGTIASEAKFTVGYFDMEARKLLTPPKEWLDACGWKA